MSFSEKPASTFPGYALFAEPPLHQLRNQYPHFEIMF